MGRGEIIKDDFLFKPYSMGGYQCIVKTSRGKISIRYGGYGLLTSPELPYEVRDEQGMVGTYTADEIWNHISGKELLESRLFVNI